MPRRNAPIHRQKKPAAVPAQEEKPAKRRAKNGSKAIKEIRRLQRSTDTVVPRAPLALLAREICLKHKDDARWTREAFDALHQATEAFMVEIMNSANERAVSKRKVTPDVSDFMFAVETCDRSTGKSVYKDYKSLHNVPGL